MTFGLQSFDASGALIFDSSTAAGGVVIDYREFSPTDTGTFTYSAYAGLTPILISLGSPQDTIVLDTSLGYPRVTVAAGGSDRRFALAVY